MITISTQAHHSNENSWSFNMTVPDFKFDFKSLNVPSMPPMTLMPPPPPPVPSSRFDYDAYKKEGDKYLERWKKEYQEKFDKDYKGKIEKWRKQFEEQQNQMAKEYAKFSEERSKMMKDRVEELSKKNVELAKAREETRKINEEVQKGLPRTEANVYYFRTDDVDKSLKVIKTIRVKMPKSAKLKMNVRHGEVTIAATIKNVQATLSHTRLLAYQIDGSQTRIEASYSPILVKNWNDGLLRVNFANEVALTNVFNLQLDANSSEVAITNLKRNAELNGYLGSLAINHIASDFKTLQMELSSTDTYVSLPNTSFIFQYRGTMSSIKYPEVLRLTSKDEAGTTIVEDIQRDKSTTKEIKINARYSKVELEQKRI